MALIKRLSLMIAFSLSLFSASSFAQDYSEGAIADRIAPIGDVYIDGEIVTASSKQAPAAPAGPRSGESIYNTFCVACHGSGLLGAPKKGDAAAWEPRVAQGQETLINHAILGFNSMPAKGTCSNCSDEEIASTVAFLIKDLY